MAALEKMPNGQRILIVEDEYFLANDAKELIASLGAHVVGPAGTIAEARELAATTDLDLAIIDLNLRGEMAYELVDEMMARAVPVILTTGYDSDGLPVRFSRCDIVQKPYGANLLTDYIGRHLPALTRRDPGTD